MYVLKKFDDVLAFLHIGFKSLMHYSLLSPGKSNLSSSSPSGNSMNDGIVMSPSKNVAFISVPSIL